MREPFLPVAAAHLASHPLAQPQDMLKLAYQSEYGPAHLALTEADALAGLQAEWRALPTGAAPAAAEPIGGGLCRFALAGLAEADLPLLARLLVLTANGVAGTPQGLAEKLTALEQLRLPGLADSLTLYRQAGMPPVHHSAAYRAAYHPHYRVIRQAHSFYFDLLRQLQPLAYGKKPMLVAIDGRCGSGKTSLAQLIAQVLPCRVFHTDDYYLPMAQRAADWADTPAGNMDLARLASQVLAPASAGQAVRYQPYRCQQGAYLPPQTLPPQPLNLLEGSYSHHPALAAYCDRKLFLTCDPAVQARRLKAREGEYWPAFPARWIPLEERYYAAFGLPAADALVLDTGALPDLC